MKLIRYVFRFLRYALTRPREAAKTFWQAFKDAKEEDRIRVEESKLHALGLAICFYKHQFGRLPAKLDDLCFNNHHDPNWDTPFIYWRGSDTFQDSFNLPYHYSVADGSFTLLSPGLETVKKHRDTSAAAGHA